MSSMVTTSGRKILKMESPADFNAVNSLRSESDPNAMIDATKMASGRARFTKRAEAYIINSAMTQGASPLPIRSSAYTQRNCMSNMNNATGMVTANGAMNERRRRREKRRTIQR